MSNDRELLELAAKAAGIQGVWNERGQCIVISAVGMSWEHWRPLDDDGDALRLAVKLGLCMTFIADCDSVQVYQQNEYAEPFNVQTEAMDGYGTRRAIVRAAAEIGRAMP